MTNREFFLQLCSSEYPRFVSILKAAPADKLEYRPHPRSRSAYELMAHLIAHEADIAELADTGTIDHRLQMPFGSIDEAVQIYSDAHAALMSNVAAIDDTTWESLGRFTLAGKVIMEMPRRDLAWIVLLDAVHHRGQLSTYLRPMGGAVPSIYGPSADTMLSAV